MKCGAADGVKMEGDHVNAIEMSHREGTLFSSFSFSLIGSFDTCHRYPDQ